MGILCLKHGYSVFKVSESMLEADAADASLTVSHWHYHDYAHPGPAQYYQVLPPRQPQQHDANQGQPGQYDTRPLTQPGKS